jgi:hypothetical protein
LAIDAAASPEAAALTQTLAGEDPSAVEPALGYAKAHIELKRIQAERNRLMATLEVDEPDTKTYGA